MYLSFYTSVQCSETLIFLRNVIQSIATCIVNINIVFVILKTARKLSESYVRYFIQIS